MDDCQRKVNQRHEGTKPRKVRFKLAASYSGRVLKHVYEDGQELDSPEEKYPHSFMHRKIPPSHLEVEQLRGFEGMPDDQQDMYPPTGLIAQRINVYRGVGSYRAAAAAQGEPVEPEAKSSVLDFGKIIIYTSNLRIVRAPHRRPETSRHHSLVVTPEAPEVCLPHRRPAETSRHHSVVVTPGAPEVCLPQARERGSRRKGKALSAHGVLVEKGTSDMQDKEVVVSCCQHCGGSGWGAPCSLCHGSKLSMLANRFNESISCLRCQACYPHGLEKCQACSPGK